VSLSDDARRNRATWDGFADEYQRINAEHIGHPDGRWGLWQLPEAELGVLGDVEGQDVLELGSGAGQWSIVLARRGARPVALDNSARQLEHARRAFGDAGLDIPTVHASADDLPFPDGSFDIVFCDWGAMTFADPRRTVPEVARVLRPGGRFAFSGATPIDWLCLDEGKDEMSTTLQRDYFGLHRREVPEGLVEFQLPYGEWIRLFRRSRLAIEDLIEIRPPEDAPSTYRTAEDLAWARRWPMEQIWKLRREA
jgi:SAM-dependent methyltransferase